MRAAVQALIDISLIANRNQQGAPKKLSDTEEDHTGALTIGTLKKTLSLVQRITGNSPGSLGLHPAVYFYGPAGRHSGAMFMGTIDLIGRKLANNDPSFFSTFTDVRSKVEHTLIEKKDLIATILQKHISQNRVRVYSELLDTIIKTSASGKLLSDQDIISITGLEGKLVVGNMVSESKDFSDDTKSKVFLDTALSTAAKCPICSGYLDTAKSTTYDHIQDKKDGGTGTKSNCQIVHPYCNSGVKNNTKSEKDEKDEKGTEGIKMR